MNVRSIDAFWDRKTRNDINYNFDFLSKSHRIIQTQLNDLVLQEGNSPLEVRQARGGHQVLADRLNSTDQQLAHKPNRSEVMSHREFYSWVATLLDGGPSIFYETLDALESDYPNGTSGVALVRETDPARIYVWNPTEKYWQDFGEYQGIEVKDGSISFEKLSYNLQEYLETDIKNKTFNGNFTQGTGGLLGWDAYSGADITADKGIALLTGDGANRQVRMRQSNDIGLDSIPYVQGKKIYVSGTFRVTNPDSTGVGFEVFGRESAGTIHSVVQNVPSQNTTYHLSDVVTLEGGSGTVLVQIKAFYQNAQAASNKSAEVSNIVVMDLTEIFGAGNEPPKEWLDGLLDTLPGRFFDGDIGSGSLSRYLITDLTTVDVALIDEITNGVRNGNFDSDDFWGNLNGASISISNNEMRVTGNGNFHIVRAYEETNLPYVLGDKIYARAEFEVDNVDCKMAGLYLTTIDNPGANETIFRKTAPRKNEPFVMSGIMENSDPTGTGKVSFYARADYEDAASANGKTLKVRKAIAINLTDAFGKGNEPTDREYIDELINRYPDKFFEDSPKEKDWRRAESGLNLSYTKQPKKPLICLTIDDGNATDYTTAWPLYRERDLKGTSWLIGHRMNTNDARWLNTDMIQEMYNDGWDFQCHTWSHLHFQDYVTDEEIRQEFNRVDDLFPTLGLPVPQHHAYPYGDYNQRVINIGLQYRKSLRATGDTSGISYNEWDRANYGALNARSIDISDIDTHRIEEIKKVIDDTIKFKGALILYHHQLLENPGQYEAKIEHVITILDYIKSKVDAGLIESVTISELVNRLKAYSA